MALEVPEAAFSVFFDLRGIPRHKRYFPHRPKPWYRRWTRKSDKKFRQESHNFVGKTVRAKMTLLGVETLEVEHRCEALGKAELRREEKGSRVASLSPFRSLKRATLLYLRSAGASFSIG